MPDQPKAIEFIARGLITRGDAVLLCRNDKHGYCYLPGGHVEPGEAAEDALRRELAEEAGADVRVAEAVLVHEERFVQRGKPRHEVSVVFHVEHSLAGPVDSREQGISFLWARPEDLNPLTIQPPSIAAWLRDRASGRGPVSGQARWISSYS